MNPSAEADAKEAELQRQKELIGEMRTAHRTTSRRRSNKEKENVGPEDIPEGKETDIIQEEKEEGQAEGDNASLDSIHGSSPEALREDDIRNGSADSTDSAGSPNSTPNPGDAGADPQSQEQPNEVAEEELGDAKELPDVDDADVGNVVDKKDDADDELSSNDERSIDTIKHVDKMPHNGGAAVALKNFEENQKEMMRQTKEQCLKQQQEQLHQSTYMLPTVFGYNPRTPTKHAADDSDSDAELFAADNCNQCQTIKRDSKQKTKGTLTQLMNMPNTAAGSSTSKETNESIRHLPDSVLEKVFGEPPAKKQKVNQSTTAGEHQTDAYKDVKTNKLLNEKKVNVLLENATTLKTEELAAQALIAINNTIAHDLIKTAIKAAKNRGSTSLEKKDVMLAAHVMF